MESKINVELRQRMENLLASPSIEIWDNIQKNLSSKEVKMHDFEVIPPEVCWENISAKMNLVGQKESRLSLQNGTRWIRYAAIVISITTLTIFAINSDIRNAIINGLNNSNIKASLPEKPYQLKKNILITDTSSFNKNLSSPLDKENRPGKTSSNK